MECNHLYSASETHFSKTMVRKYLDTKNCADPLLFYGSFRLLTLSFSKLHNVMIPERSTVDSGNSKLGYVSNFVY